MARRTAWVQAAVSTEELFDLVAYPGGDHLYKSRSIHDMQHSSAAMAGWLKRPRPLSAVTEAEFTLKVTAEELEAAAQRVLAGGDGAFEYVEPCPSQFFRGFMWQLYVQVTVAEDGLRFCIYLQVQDEELYALGPGQHICCTATFTACQEAPGAGEEGRLTIPARLETQFSVDNCWGWPDFWELSPQAGWDAVQRRVCCLCRRRCRCCWCCCRCA